MGIVARYFSEEGMEEPLETSHEITTGLANAGFDPTRALWQSSPLFDLMDVQESLFAHRDRRRLPVHLEVDEWGGHPEEPGRFGLVVEVARPVVMPDTRVPDCPEMIDWYVGGHPIDEPEAHLMWMHLLLATSEEGGRFGHAYVQVVPMPAPIIVGKRCEDWIALGQPRIWS
jgi:hypothetical protein